MARVVESVALEYGSTLHWEKVVTKTLTGAQRFLELSRALGRPAPVPAIFIADELVFDTTPSEEELRTCLNRYLAPSEI